MDFSAILSFQRPVVRTSALPLCHSKGGTAMPHSVQERTKTPMDAKKAGAEILWFLAGTLMYALALNLFLIGNNIAAGGFAGIATVLCNFIPMKVGTLMFLMNFPLLLASLFVKGAKFTVNTLVCSFLYSAILNLTDFLPTLTDDPLVASLFGGVLYGIGMVCLIRSNSSVGGTDLLNRLLVVAFPQVSVGKMCMIIDGAAVVFAMIAFRDVQLGLYAIITLYVCSVFADHIMGGFDRGNLCFVITDGDPTQIAQDLMHRLNRAVTKLDGTGMYSGTQRSVLMMAVRPSETFIVKREIYKLDPHAFVVVAQANEVLGGGFKPLVEKP